MIMVGAYSSTHRQDADVPGTTVHLPGTLGLFVSPKRFYPGGVGQTPQRCRTRAGRVRRAVHSFPYSCYLEIRPPVGRPFWPAVIVLSIEPLRNIRISTAKNGSLSRIVCGFAGDLFPCLQLLRRESGYTHRAIVSAGSVVSIADAAVAFCILEDTVPAAVPSRWRTSRLARAIR
jgi:hypothetical protein